MKDHPMTQVIVFPRGQLTPKDKEKLTKLGLCAVEADDPSAVVVIVPSAPMVSADDLLMSALFGMSGQSAANERASAMAELHRRLLKREQERTTP
jgi:hypothetical protein